MECFNYSTIDNVQTMAAGTAHVKILSSERVHLDYQSRASASASRCYRPECNGWRVVSTSRPHHQSDTVAAYQKMPFKIVVTKF